MPLKILLSQNCHFLSLQCDPREPSAQGPDFLGCDSPLYAAPAKPMGRVGYLLAYAEPLTDRLEAKQLRMCLLSKRELRY